MLWNHGTPWYQDAPTRIGNGNQDVYRPDGTRCVRWCLLVVIAALLGTATAGTATLRRLLAGTALGTALLTLNTIGSSTQCDAWPSSIIQCADILAAFNRITFKI